MPVTINGSTGIATPDGSASVPSHTGSSGATNGLYFPTSTSAALATNGAVAVTISSSQYVGIASSSPTAPLTVGNITNSWSVGNISAMIASTAINAGGLTIGGSIGTASAAGSTTYIFTDTTTGVGGIQVKNFAGTQYDLALQQQGGNVGIGTTSPNGKLDVNAGARTVLAISANSQYWQLDNRGTFDSTSNALVIGYNGAVEVARFTPSGNLGLGVTPSAWKSGARAIELSNAGDSFSTGYSNGLNFTRNTYYNSSNQFIYATSDWASRYAQVSGQHQWFTAPIGTANAAISFTQAMTLGSDGRLAIGKTINTTSGFAGTLQVKSNSTSYGGISLEKSDDDSTLAIGYFSTSGAWTFGSTYGSTGSYLPIAFYTSSIERLRIDSSGNVGIGTTSPQARFHSKAGATSQAGIFEAANSVALLSFVGSSTSSYTRVQIGADVNDMVLYTTGTERARIDSSGNVLVTGGGGLGYGTGSGGAVTQGAGSGKSTAVTLNKTSGQIVMNNAALAASTTVTFQLNNTFINGSDLVLVTVYDSVTTAGSYQVWATDTRTGLCQINLRNMTAGSLSNAVYLNFAVIKGVWS